MNIEKRILPVGTMKRPGTKLSCIQGVTIHNTGNYSRGAGADAHANYCHNSCNSAYDSYHYVVDDKKAIQLIPEDEVSWHAGDGATGPGNTTTISIEICVNPDSDLAKATDNAAQLAAQILNRHGVELMFQHWHWTGKNCPAEIRAGKPYSWNTFVDKVTAYQRGGQTAATKPTASVKPAAKSWTQNCTLKVGEKVRSISCRIAPYPGTNNAIKDGCVYVPDLGGLVPLAHVSEAKDTGDGRCDNTLQNTKARVFLDETTVQAVDVKKDLVKVHGYWVKAGPLMGLR